MTPSLIHDLCERYERNKKSYRSDTYNEAQARQEFINPLFKLLGWDMDNEQGYAEAYKEVVHEDAIRIGGAIKAPDYSFRIGGQRKFFLEAKRPQVSVVDQKDPAYQLRRYAWSAKLPLSILTNFSELAVYDCRYRPETGDAPSRHRVEYFTFEKYAEKWEYLVNTFSREAILKGSFDKYAQGMKGKRGTQEVDSEFLKEIELWREILAKNLKLRNKDLSIEALNFAVGRIIDRIIFLRVCEDRGIEEYGQLEGLLKGSGLYDSLVKLFKRADERYNSGLFHFQKEKGRGEQPDTLTPTLTVDDRILKDVLRTLYYPQSPYEFRVFPADILGQVYEQFLGKVIVKSGRSVEVEEKPEVRKAGGVYYTPTYIVDYIVKHTVGKLVEDKTPDDVSKLRVLDPACGSGSFLIGAYQYLLDWHLAYYAGAAGGPTAPSKVGNAKRKGTANLPIYETPAGYRLTLAERKRILLNNIYGVDIDGQAVEVTKLSLLLKVLEGSNAAEVQGELSLRHHALPDLGENIKCGNSLVGPDILKTPPNPPVNGGGPELTDEEIARINPFDWHAEFKDVFKQGGFDAVIGNPPYSSKQSIETKRLTAFFDLVEYKCDPFAFFLEQALRLSKKMGRVGFIVPLSWMTNVYYEKLRRHLIESQSLSEIVMYDGLVFNNANTDTSIVILHKNAVQSDSFLWSVTKAGSTANKYFDRSYESVLLNERADIPPSVDPVWATASARMVERSVNLNEIAKIPLGMILRSNKEFISEKKDKAHPDVMIFGDDIGRYQEFAPRRFYKFSKAVIVGGTKREIVHRTKPKIFIQAIRNLSLKRRIVASLDSAGYSFIGTVNAVILENSDYGIHYVLGLLNSRLLNEYYARRFHTVYVKAATLGFLPIRTINFKDKADKARHDKMVKLVERMLELNKKLPEVKTPNEREKLERQIAATDREIDELVYELYGLTEEEIAIVEGRPHPPSPSP